MCWTQRKLCSSETLNGRLSESRWLVQTFRTDLERVQSLLIHTQAPPFTRSQEGWSLSQLTPGEGWVRPLPTTQGASSSQPDKHDTHTPIILIQDARLDGGGRWGTTVSPPQQSARLRVGVSTLHL